MVFKFADCKIIDTMSFDIRSYNTYINYCKLFECKETPVNVGDCADGAECNSVSLSVLFAQVNHMQSVFLHSNEGVCLYGIVTKYVHFLCMHKYYKQLSQLNKYCDGFIFYY